MDKQVILMTWGREFHAIVLLDDELWVDVVVIVPGLGQKLKHLQNQKVGP